MLVRRRMLATASAVLLAFALAACTPGQSSPTKSPSAVATPLFSSDEEALKAATDAYAAYLKMSDTISHDGGANPERIGEFVTPSELDKLTADFAQLRDSGRHTTGDSHFSKLRVERYDSRQLTVYLCSDVSDVRVLDGQGSDVTPSTRTDILPLAITLSGSKDGLLVAESTKWSGQDFCR